jgi:hypothetical protein
VLIDEADDASRVVGRMSVAALARIEGQAAYP